MERIEEMKVFIRDLLESSIKKRIQQAIQRSLGDQKGIEGLKSAMQSLVDDRKGCLCISYLRSSYITGTDDFEIAFYEGTPFIESGPECFYYRPVHAFTGIEEDLQSLGAQLRKGFIRIISGETEEIRRYYMERLYEQCGDVFLSIMKDWEWEDIEIYYGEYMGELKRIYGPQGSVNK